MEESKSVREKLNRNTRLVVYSYISTTYLFFKMSRLSMQERNYLVEQRDSQICPRQVIVLKYPQESDIGYNLTTLMTFFPRVNIEMCHTIKSNCTESSINGLLNLACMYPNTLFDITIKCIGI